MPQAIPILALAVAAGGASYQGYEASEQKDQAKKQARKQEEAQRTLLNQQKIEEDRKVQADQSAAIRSRTAVSPYTPTGIFGQSVAGQQSTILGSSPGRRTLLGS